MEIFYRTRFLSVKIFYFPLPWTRNEHLPEKGKSANDKSDLGGNYGSDVTLVDIKQVDHHHHDHRHHDRHHDPHDNDEGSGAPASVGVDPSGGAPTEEVLASWRKSLEQVIIILNIILLKFIILKIILLKIIILNIILLKIMDRCALRYMA